MPGDVGAVDPGRPLGGSSKPAIIRSVVVLPQPLGPSRVKNSPSAMSRSMVVDGGQLAEALGDASRVTTHGVTSAVVWW